MIRDRVPLPAHPKIEAEKQFKEMWCKVPGFGEDTWEDARLRSVARYLLGAKGLNVPKDWEWIIPDFL